MPGVDDEILKMQHLEAQAKRQMEERAAQASADALGSRARKLAAEAQQEIDSARKQEDEARAKGERARGGGLPPLEAADLLSEANAASRDAHTRLVKAQARLNFALDQMDEAERKAWEATQAGARADAHGQLADET
jgi:hypothetical protein